MLMIVACSVARSERMTLTNRLADWGLHTTHVVISLLVGQTITTLSNFVINLKLFPHT